MCREPAKHTAFTNFTLWQFQRLQAPLCLKLMPGLGNTQANLANNLGALHDFGPVAIHERIANEWCDALSYPITKALKCCGILNLPSFVGNSIASTIKLNIFQSRILKTPSRYIHPQAFRNIRINENLEANSTIFSRPAIDSKIFCPNTRMENIRLVAPDDNRERGCIRLHWKCNIAIRTRVGNSFLE